MINFKGDVYEKKLVCLVNYFGYLINYWFNLD